MKLSLLLALISLGFGVTLRADIYRVVGKANTIAPLQSSEITMVAETVVVMPENRFGGFHVRAEFTMHNTADAAVNCDVAFPFESRAHASNARESFKVVMGDGADAVAVGNIELKSRDASVDSPRSPYDFAAALVWPVRWMAGETKTIRIDYDMGEPEEYRGYVEGWRLRYIVRTGALWKGPIGRADITLRLDGNPMLAPDFATPGEKFIHLKPPYSYPANATQTSPTEVRWHFENWIPEEDVWLGVVRWIGFDAQYAHNIWLAMPNPYGGATADYTDTWLESLVDREFARWQDTFPTETSRNRPPLKALIAEWLYREIFARHGDPFYLGKGKIGEPGPTGSRGRNQKGFHQSIWSERFPLASRGRGGWYKPGTGRGRDGSVRLSDLTAREQRNAEFLRSHFTP